MTIYRQAVSAECSLPFVALGSSQDLSGRHCSLWHLLFVRKTESSSAKSHYWSLPVTQFVFKTIALWHFSSRFDFYRSNDYHEKLNIEVLSYTSFKYLNEKIESLFRLILVL